MSRILTIIILNLAMLLSNSWAQDYGGAPPGVTPKGYTFLQGQTSVAEQTLLAQNDFTYQTTTYTFADLVVFSYQNDTQIYILNSMGSVLDSIILEENDYQVFSPGPGVYTIQANNPFSLLVGDPVTNIVLGYFAVDQTGSPLSTRLNTYFPDDYYGPEVFVVFAYEDNTEFQIENLADGSIIASGILNRGEHYEMSSNFDTFLGVQANKPVSALSYTDQGYYIPATNGTFAGTEFFGYSAYLANWINGIIVTAYHDSTIFTILDTATGDTLATDTLNTGEVYPYSVNTPTYYTVMSNKLITVCNTPYAGFSGYYYHLVRLIDESGRGIGTNFYAPVIQGDLNVFSYEDSNRVIIYDMTYQNTLADTLLNKGDNFYVFTNKTVLHITSTGNVSAISSYGGGYGADFMPLNYALQLPDLVIGTSDIIFDPEKTSWTPGEAITIYATVTNMGNATAKDIIVQFFDGPPEGGNAISTRFYKDSLQAGESIQFGTDWTVPDNPEYHKVYVKTHVKTGQESSTANNVASRPLVPNKDLAPPLSTTIKAPATVQVQGDTTNFRTFELTVNIFNSGDTTAFNARAILHLPPEWSVVQDSTTKAFSPQDSTVNDTIRYFGDVAVGESDSYTWTIQINNLPSGDAYYYSVDILADNAEAKNVKGVMQVEQPTAIHPLENGNLPKQFALKPAYPNPFNPSTIIPFELSTRAPVELTIYNINGQRVAVLVKETLPAGQYQVPFQAQNLSNGIYFVHLRAGAFQQTRKIVLMK